MKDFNKEQLDFLAQYEDNFRRSIELNYYRNMTTKALDAVKATYDSVADEPFAENWGCNHCILKFLQMVGRKYFADLDAYKTKAAKLVETLDEVFGEVPDELEPAPAEDPAPKKSRKKATSK